MQQTWLINPAERRNFENLCLDFRTIYAEYTDQVLAKILKCFEISNPVSGLHKTEFFQLSLDVRLIYPDDYHRCQFRQRRIALLGSLFKNSILVLIIFKLHLLLI